MNANRTQTNTRKQARISFDSIDQIYLFLFKLIHEVYLNDDKVHEYYVFWIDEQIDIPNFIRIWYRHPTFLRLRWCRRKVLATRCEFHIGHVTSRCNPVVYQNRNCLIFQHHRLKIKWTISIRNLILRVKKRVTFNATQSIK